MSTAAAARGTIIQTAESRIVNEHVSEAWRMLVQLPAEERQRLGEYLAGCYAWSEVEADITAMWRASLDTESPETMTSPPG